MLTVTTAATSRTLTTLGRVKLALEISTSVNDEWIERDLIPGASAAAERYCRRIFAREALSETLIGPGGNDLILSRAPIVAVASVLADGAAITDYTIENAGAGLLGREFGWTPGFNRRLFGADYPMGDLDRRPFTVAYTAGWLLPGDNVQAAGIVVTAADKTFNDALGRFPLLVAGDVIVTKDFVQAANNGRFTVVSRTAAKITVAETVVDEPADADLRTLLVRTLPDDIERAVVDTIKSWYVSRSRDEAVVERRIDDVTIRYAQPGVDKPDSESLTGRAMGLLRGFVRYAA